MAAGADVGIHPKLPCAGGVLRNPHPGTMIVQFGAQSARGDAVEALARQKPEVDQAAHASVSTGIPEIIPPLERPPRLILYPVLDCPASMNRRLFVPLHPEARAYPDNAACEPPQAPS